MGKLEIMEERPRWVEILRYLDKHHARGPAGFQVDRKTFAKGVRCDDAVLGKYIKEMEGYGIVRVQRTTIDGAFGSPRGNNRYFLLCTLERWETQLGPAIIAERHERIQKQRAAINRNTAREMRRKNELAKRQKLAKELGLVEPTSRRAPPEVREAARAATRPAPAPVVMPDDELQVLVARYDGVDDAELVGW